MTDKKRILDFIPESLHEDLFAEVEEKIRQRGGIRPQIKISQTQIESDIKSWSESERKKNEQLNK